MINKKSIVQLGVIILVTAMFLAFYSNLNNSIQFATGMTTNSPMNMTNEHNINLNYEDSSKFLNEDNSQKQGVDRNPIYNTLISASSEQIDPFYYLDADLESYYQLSKCHGFVGNKFDKITGGTLSGYTGEGITICVIDIGVAYNHSYFSAGYNSLVTTKVITSSSGDVRNPTSTDYDDHATECVSTIKQIAPKAKIISISCQSLSNSAYLEGAFQWIYDNFQSEQIKLVSMSLNTALEDIPSNNDDIEDLIKQLSGNINFGSTGEKLIEEKRILFSFSAGNEPYSSTHGYAVRWPANLGNLANVYGVGGSNFNNIRVKYDETNSIYNTDSKIRLNCQAPGKDLKLASYNEVTGNESQVTASGTSYSAPLVTGALALTYEKYGKSGSLAYLITCKYTTIAGLTNAFDVNDNPFFTINLQPNEFKDAFGFSNYSDVKQYYGFGILNIPGMLNISDIDEDGLTDYHELYYSSGFDFLDPWNSDTDGDGMLDGWEHKYYQDFGNGTIIFDPLTSAIGSGLYESGGDPDFDGLSNDVESQAGSNPFMNDTDLDNLTDREELNGYFVGYPGSFDNPSFYFWISEDGTVTSDPTKQDTDMDGLSDYEELIGTRITIFAKRFDGSPVTYINHLVRTCPTHSDTDLDGLSDADELSGVTVWTYANNSICSEINVQLNPLNNDLDDDCLLDGMEVNGFLNPSNIEETFYADPRLGDTDQDGVCDGNETYYSLDPLDFDCDTDNISDGKELNGYHGYVTDPAKSDTDSDGINDNVEIFGIYLPSSDNANGTGYIFTDPTDSDDDNDSILDGEELIAGSDGYLTDPTDNDTDNDGLDDDDEINIHSTNPSENDTDNDGLIDSDELWTYLTDPTTDDSDNDGLDDFEELFTYYIDPLDNDTDNDNLLDGYEVLTLGTDPDDNDSDNDTILDGEEVILGSDGYITDPLDDDTDSDGLSDANEINTYGTNPTDSDSDNDGWSDGFEVNTSGTDPTDDDTDNDGIDDKDEFDYWKSRGKTNATAYAYCDNDDVDNDGLDDGFEINLGVDPLDNDCDNDGLEVNNYQTDPEDSDTDGDSYDDLYEIINGYDPLDPDDYPGSGGWGWG